MQRALRPSALIPPGFAFERASTLDTVTTIAVVSVSTSSCCPICGTASHRTHSCYVRKIGDLPLAGYSVSLLATVRRFWCDAVRCGRRIFAERFADGARAMGKANRAASGIDQCRDACLHSDDRHGFGFR